jgi:hypothetical protein
MITTRTDQWNSNTLLLATKTLTTSHQTTRNHHLTQLQRMKQPQTTHLAIKKIQATQLQATQPQAIQPTKPSLDMLLQATISHHTMKKPTKHHIWAQITKKNLTTNQPIQRHQDINQAIQHHHQDTNQAIQRHQDTNHTNKFKQISLLMP